jgi:membrane protease YdiL (CAAX protease family)
MAPRTVAEFVAWFGVSLTAGLCEELIFRGYLLQQLTAWTRRPVTSIFLAALLFGSVHLYEGVGAILPLAALAVVYGFVVRHFKGDLRAVVVAHTLQDFLVAFLVLAKPYLERFQQTH